MTLKRLIFLLLLAGCLILIARVSERHVWQWDVSTQRINSLSEAAHQALDQLPGRLELIAFVPDLAVQRAELAQLLAPYLAHPSQPLLHYIDPVAKPETAREFGVGGQIELHLIAGPRREVVSRPSNTAIDRALNRLALRGERWIVSLRGHGEAEIDATPSGLARFAEQTEQLGYHMLSLDPRQIDALPDNTAVLLIAAPTRAYETHTQNLVEAYLADGGPLLWLGVETLPVSLVEDLGVNPLPGIVVDATAARHNLDKPDHAIVTDYPSRLLQRPPAQASALPKAVAFEIAERDTWQTVATLQSSPLSWNETGAVQGRLARDPNLGETAGPLIVGAAFESRTPTSSARIVLLGSSHLLGNTQLGLAGNLDLTLGLLNWLSDNPALIVDRPGPDLDIRWSPQVAAILALGLMGGLPLLYLGTGLWLRRRRSRQ